MKTFVIAYVEGTQLKHAYVKAAYPADAGKEFGRLYPDIDEDDVLSVEEVDRTKEEYGTSLFFSRLVSFVGWVIGILSLLLMVWSIVELFGKHGNLALAALWALSPAFGGIIVGIVLIIIGQSSRALLDTANYTRKMYYAQVSMR